MYTATYESIVEGGSSPPGSDPRDEELLELARTQLARKNLRLVRLEHNGEIIWFRGTWVRVQPERKGDADATD